ncbi:hypothetical protein T4A_2117 [Trichinella pseudospiralis]|uniref:Uncharacterized protein n=1 Tax=Trichinella pseudospiralis TaxID=6337 RepID=A0A0V1EDM3_TRIPS|nr:hypothetical protein T4A_2117 [Trichinella pseudospiralis]
MNNRSQQNCAETMNYYHLKYQSACDCHFVFSFTKEVALECSGKAEWSGDAGKYSKDELHMHITNMVASVLAIHLPR